MAQPWELLVFGIIGIVLLFGCVFGVFVAHGGDLAPIIHAAPSELATIGGAAIGALISRMRMANGEAGAYDLGFYNIGVRPTFGSAGPLSIEAHVLGQPGDLYGQPVRLRFVQRLREERRFADVDALVAQIQADVRQATRLFAKLTV